MARNQWFVVVLIGISALSTRPASAQQRVDRAEHHEFTIENFRTESGVTLPKATIVYGTAKKPSAPALKTSAGTATNV